MLLGLKNVVFESPDPDKWARKRIEEIPRGSAQILSDVTVSSVARRLVPGQTVGRSGRRSMRVRTLDRPTSMPSITGIGLNGAPAGRFLDVSGWVGVLW